MLVLKLLSGSYSQCSTQTCLYRPDLILEGASPFHKLRQMNLYLCSWGSTEFIRREKFTCLILVTIFWPFDPQNCFLFHFIFRCHFEFQLNEPPLKPFWFTPAKFEGQIILFKDTGKPVYMTMEVPNTNHVNVGTKNAYLLTWKFIFALKCWSVYLWGKKWFQTWSGFHLNVPFTLTLVICL